MPGAAVEKEGEGDSRAADGGIRQLPQCACIPA